MEIALYSIESGVLRLSCHAWVKAVLAIITGDESWLLYQWQNKMSELGDWCHDGEVATGKQYNNNNNAV